MRHCVTRLAGIWIFHAIMTSVFSKQKKVWDHLRPSHLEAPPRCSMLLKILSFGSSQVNSDMLMYRVSSAAIRSRFISTNHQYERNHVEQKLPSGKRVARCVPSIRLRPLDAPFPSACRRRMRITASSPAGLRASTNSCLGSVPQDLMLTSLVLPLLSSPESSTLSSCRAMTLVMSTFSQAMNVCLSADTRLSPYHGL